MYSVSVHRCDEYDYEKIKETIKKEIDELGGIGKFVSEGERVAIKPNLIMMKDPDEAATTHPQLIRAVAELVAEAGACAVIAESPGGPFNEKLLKITYKKCGIIEAAELSGAELNYNTEVSERAFPEGKLLKRITVVNEIANADTIDLFSFSLISAFVSSYLSYSHSRVSPAVRFICFLVSPIFVFHFSSSLSAMVYSLEVPFVIGRSSVTAYPAFISL